MFGGRAGHVRLLSLKAENRKGEGAVPAQISVDLLGRSNVSGTHPVKVSRPVSGRFSPDTMPPEVLWHAQGLSFSRINFQPVNFLQRSARNYFSS